HEGAGRRKSSIAIGEQHVRSEVRIAFRIRQFGESRQNYRHLLRTVDQGRLVYEQAHAMVLFHGGKYEERRQLQNHPVKSQYTKLRLLCKSLAGNNIYYLTVTDNSTDDIQEPKPKKKAVVMTARVHPGESPASWMMKGVIDFITGDSLQAKTSCNNFYFSDEGELSDLSDDERRRREDHVITAPPPSPVHPSHKKHKPKRGFADPDCSPGSGQLAGQRIVGRRIASPQRALHGRLVATSFPEKRLERNEQIADGACAGADQHAARIDSHFDEPNAGDHGFRKAVQTVRQYERQNGELSDPEYRPPSEVSLPIKKHFWRALSNDNIPWSANYNEHEDLLR
ncbi:unnamed protein product, partial [Nesidiocoris tenuis]